MIKYISSLLDAYYIYHSPILHPGLWILCPYWTYHHALRTPLSDFVFPVFLWTPSSPLLSVIDSISWSAQISRLVSLSLTIWSKKDLSWSMADIVARDLSSLLLTIPSRWFQNKEIWIQPSWVSLQILRYRLCSSIWIISSYTNPKVSWRIRPPSKILHSPVSQDFCITIPVDICQSIISSWELVSCID